MKESQVRLLKRVIVLVLVVLAVLGGIKLWQGGDDVLRQIDSEVEGEPDVELELEEVIEELEDGG